MSDTLWESLCKNVSYKLIAALPEIIRQGRPGIPPLINYRLPPVEDFDLGRRVVRCAEPEEEVGFNRVSVTGILLNGLDTVSRFEPITFPARDVRLIIPLVFAKIEVTGKWQIQQQCKADWLTRTGTFACAYKQIQVDVTIAIDYQVGKATSVSVALTDRTRSWASQPEVNVTFDKVPPGERAIIKSLVEAVFKGQVELRGVNFKTEVRKVIEGQEVSGRVKTVINTFLDKIFEGTGEGNLLQKLERRFNREWKALFTPGHPGYLPNKFPERMAYPLGKRFDLPFPLPVLPRVGWFWDGNAYALFPSATVGGLRTVTPRGNVTFHEDGFAVNVPLQFFPLQADNGWSLEQKMKKICPVMTVFASLGIEATDANLNPFYKIQQDLRERGGKMGNWYVDRYWKHAQELIDLLEHERFKRDIERFNGLKIWDTVMKIISSAGSREPITFPEDLQDDALTLLQRAIDYTEGKPLGATLVSIVEGNYVFAYIGKNYSQVLSEIAKQSPPAARADEEVVDEAVPPEAVSGVNGEVVRFQGTWKFICTPLALTSRLRIMTGRDGAAPTLSLLSSEVWIGHFDFDYTSEYELVWLIKFLVDHVFPFLKQFIGEWLQSYVAKFISENQQLPDGVQQAINEIWNTPLV